MNIEEHLLICASEECLEIAKDISKALRFGLNDRNVLDPEGPTNRERIVNEINDLIGVLDMLEDHDILPRHWHDYEKQEAKQEKVNKFIDYAESVGALKKEP
jgi:hypothetical protein